MGSICYNSIQMPHPVETAELVAFSKTVQAKSLTRAAAELSVPRATLSRRLARLEQRLGVRLLRRTTRSLVLTDAGTAFYRHAQIVLAAVEQAEQSVRRSDDAVLRGDLRVSLPPGNDPAIFALLCQFAETHPQVRLHLHFSSQHVDLRRDGYDVALRAGTTLEPGLYARTLARMSLIAVAAPAYLAAHGTPRSVRELKQHRCLLSFVRGELPQSHWPLADGGQVHVEGTLASNDIMFIRAAALRGLGIALLPAMMLQAELASGALVQVLAGKVEVLSQLAVVYPEREFVPPQVKALVNALVKWRPGVFEPAGVTQPAKKRKKATK